MFLGLFLKFFFLTLGLLSIRLYNLFWFAFWSYDLGNELVVLTQVIFIVFLIIFFSTLSFNIGLIENWSTYFFLIFFSMGLSRPHDLGHVFCGLAKLILIFFVLFNWTFLSSCFNIGLIENWSTYFFLIFFSMGLSRPHDLGHVFCGLAKLILIFLFFLIGHF
jgi:hypothetical protein